MWKAGVRKLVYLVCPLFLIKLEGRAIVTVFYLVTGHPLIIWVHSLCCQVCQFFAAAQIRLEPLILIIASWRPTSLLSTPCLRVQSPLYGRMVRIQFGRSGNLSIRDRAAFHSKGSLTYFAKEKEQNTEVEYQRAIIWTVRLELGGIGGLYDYKGGFKINEPNNQPTTYLYSTYWRRAKPETFRLPRLPANIWHFQSEPFEPYISFISNAAHQTSFLLIPNYLYVCSLLAYLSNFLLHYPLTPCLPAYLLTYRVEKKNSYVSP